MVKKLFPLLAYALMALLTACVAAPEQVMTPLQYHQNISLHSHKNIYLYWQSGTQFTEDQPVMVQSTDPLVALVGSAIDAQQRKNNPGRYTYTYGNAQQAVFMTSFKNILIKHHVFNHVELVTEPKALGPNDILMTVKFKSTRISDFGEQFAITLSVDTSIKSNDQKLFSRSYVVHNSSPESIWTSRTFKEQQSEVSQKLLSKLIFSLEEWHSHK